MTVSRYGGSYYFYFAIYSISIFILFFSISVLISCFNTLRKESKTKKKKQENLTSELAKKVSKEQENLEEQYRQLEAHRLEIIQELQREKKQIEKKEKKATDLAESTYKLMNETSQSYPWLADKFSDFLFTFDQEKVSYLRNKSRPALKSAEIVHQISREKRELQKQCKMYEYQIGFYETLFPWLEEFKQCDPKTAASYVLENEENPSSEYDTMRNWISPEEYQTLSTAEKYQRALDRYKARKKTDWEAGIEYERYIGYLCEQKGYHVSYQGAVKGMEDMGIDVIAVKDEESYIIQCKRWAKEKTLHEKHIFQLYGTTVVYKLEHPNQSVTSVFVTTTKLSELAKKCATFLDIQIKEEFPMKEYPLIKCNISKDGEKIYHLPFDQQYDKIIISADRGESYAFTVKEAEEKGFRRAFRWKGNRDQSRNLQ